MRKRSSSATLPERGRWDLQSQKPPRHRDGLAGALQPVVPPPCHADSGTVVLTGSTAARLPGAGAALEAAVLCSVPALHLEGDPPAARRRLEAGHHLRLLQRVDEDTCGWETAPRQSPQKLIRAAGPLLGKGAGDGVLPGTGVFRVPATPLTFHGLLAGVGVHQVGGDAQGVAVGTGLHPGALQGQSLPGGERVQTRHGPSVRAAGEGDTLIIPTGRWGAWT